MQKNKKCDLITLPTEKMEGICYNNKHVPNEREWKVVSSLNIEWLKSFRKNKWHYLHIYLVSDEPVTLDCWVYDSWEKGEERIHKVTRNPEYFESGLGSKIACENNRKRFFKVEASTDPLLIDLPAIPVKFLVDYLDKRFYNNYEIKKVVIRYQEPYQGNITITVTEFKDLWEKQEVEYLMAAGYGLGKSVAREPDYYSLSDPLQDLIDKNL